MNTKWKDHIQSCNAILEKVDDTEITNCINLIYNAWETRRKIFIIGNGGSALNASHFAQDLTKGTIKDGTFSPRIRAVSLCNDIGFITATSNDDSYNNIFVNQLVAFAEADDILFTISGSGNSPNLIKAVEWAKSNDLVTSGILGYDGGDLKNMLENCIHINLNHMETVEGLMSVILHYVMCEVRQKLKV